MASRRFILHFCALLAATQSLGACQRKETAENTASSAQAAPADSAKVSAPSASAVSAAAPAVTSCKREMDCNVPYGCRAVCLGPLDKTGYCQVQFTSAKVGDGPCVGYKLGTGRGSSWDPHEPKPVPEAVLCDVDQGVYCEKSSKQCTAVKSLGAACETDNECGKDGACVKDKCVSAQAAGQSCADVRCRSSAYCDDKDVCRPRKALGESCSESTQCQSLSCTGTCAEREEQKCSLPRG